jgi:serine/threonine-protein kinase TTK/MPS1
VLILASLDEKPIPIFHADDSLKADREVVLEAVWQDGDALEHADDSLKADREVVLEAAKSWGDALRHADDIALRRVHIRLTEPLTILKISEYF